MGSVGDVRSVNVAREIGRYLRFGKYQRALYYSKKPRPGMPAGTTTMLWGLEGKQWV